MDCWGGGMLMQHSAISIEYCCAVYCRIDVKVFNASDIKVCMCM